MGAINPFDIFSNPNFVKDSETALFKLFSSRIKESFLKGVRARIYQEHPEIVNLYDLQLTHEKMLIHSNYGLTDYELCRHIVAIHRSNCIGLKPEQRTAKERSDEYKKQLSDAVYYQLQIRDYAAAFYRNRPIIDGEDWLFYPIPYKLFALCIKANEILQTYTGEYKGLLTNIFNKAIGALILIEDNLLDSAYPIARGVIELYFKFLVLVLRPEAIQLSNQLASLEIEKGAHNGEPPDALKNLFAGRKCPREKGLTDYMHFGWTDDIADYQATVNVHPYSINGLKEYLKIVSNGQNDDYFDSLIHLHARCHVFTHGTLGNSGYPLLHYLDLSGILLYTIHHSYKLLLEITGEDGLINGLDVAQSLDEDRTLFTWQYNNKSTEMFETFHNYKK